MISAHDCTGVACRGSGFESVLRRESQVVDIDVARAQRGRIGRPGGSNWAGKGCAGKSGRREG
eukprot:4352673-Prymnesium_polylepis.2